MRKVGAGTSLEWIRDAIVIVRSHPGVFLPMGLILTLIPLVPVFGPVVMLLLGPALMGGMIHAARETRYGRNPKIGDLFRAFQEGDRIGSFMALCLPIFAAIVLLIGLAIPIATRAIDSGQVTRQTLADPHALQTALVHVIATMGTGMVWLLLVAALAVMLLAGMATFLATALVMLGRRTAFPAMKASFLACTRNFGAFVITVLLVGIAAQGLQLVLNLFLPVLLAAVLANVPYYAVFGTLGYTAYRSIFDDSEEAGDTNSSSYTAPAASRHTFEA